MAAQEKILKMVLFWLLATVCWLLCVDTRVNAAVIVWEAQDHVVGNWEVTLNGIADHEIFPLQVEDANDNNHPHTNQNRRRRSISCQLSILPNGTFTLEPKHQQDKKDSRRETNLHTTTMKSSTTATTTTSRDVEPDKNRRLYLHGRWKVEQNPYCVTDRFYDHLLLEGYPRVQRLIPTDDLASTKHKLSFKSRASKTSAAFSTPGPASHHQKQLQPVVLQQVAIRLTCRIWGRYYRQRRHSLQRQQQQQKQARPLSLARMTHGSVLWQVQYDHPHASADSSTLSQQKRIPWWKQQRRRRVAATFSGRLSSSSNDNNAAFQQDDQDIFGY